MKAMIKTVRGWLEILQGVRAVELSGIQLVALGIWWALLIWLTLFASGRGSRFIYVDF
jgi:hypothetical protein